MTYSSQRNSGNLSYGRRGEKGLCIVVQQSVCVWAWFLVALLVSMPASIGRSLSHAAEIRFQLYGARIKCLPDIDQELRQSGNWRFLPSVEATNWSKCILTFSYSSTSILDRDDLITSGIVEIMTIGRPPLNGPRRIPLGNEGTRRRAEGALAIVELPAAFIFIRDGHPAAAVTIGIPSDGSRSGRWSPTIFVGTRTK
jgi:hypothetical protein